MVDEEFLSSQNKNTKSPAPFISEAQSLPHKVSTWRLGPAAPI